jgi:hypothetical protein
MHSEADSQPLDASPSQSKNPESHWPTVQIPALHVVDRLAKTSQAFVHEPQ